MIMPTLKTRAIEAVLLRCRCEIDCWRRREKRQAVYYFGNRDVKPIISAFLFL
jgi:hypothetical protein